MPIKFTFSTPMMRSWLLIHQCHRLIERNELAVLKKVGLTPRKHAVLLALKRLPGPLKVVDVAVWLDRKANGISRLVDRMEKDGIINRTRDTLDRRATSLTITEKGQQIYEKAEELFFQLIRDIFKEFSEDELITLSKIMERVRVSNFKLLFPSKKPETLQILED
ncbi:MAG: MarR family transcriptional regulator [Dehalococcoidales bacterium]|nr:MarR family transcriptional regulator [Dehalococcoidales bacterium]